MRSSLYATPNALREVHNSAGKRSGAGAQSRHPATTLHGTLGNLGVQRLLTTRAVQAKLRVSQPQDSYEQEADRVADRVMRMAVPEGASPCPACTAARAPCAACNAESSNLVLRSTGTASADHATIAESDHTLPVSGPGRPLDAASRSFFEPRFNRSFGHVRVHADKAADDLASQFDARALTVGRDLVFRSGEYAPHSQSGRRLLAHELTHVVQQSDGLGRMVMRDIVSANPSPSGGGGKPPAGLTGCHVYLGGRTIDHWLAGTLGFRHLYIDEYEGPTDYALIEGGPVGSSTTGTSGAWVKPKDWDARGVRWDITPHVHDCPAFVSCLKRKTGVYNAAAHPYHYSKGPNSNSFAWWVLNECGLNVSFLLSSWPYLAYDYWITHPAGATAPTPAPVLVPAGP
jgi:hypothetical protein